METKKLGLEVVRLIERGRREREVSIVESEKEKSFKKENPYHAIGNVSNSDTTCT